MKNKIVESVWLSRDQREIAIVFDDNTHCEWVAVGDCCADAWIEAVESFDFKGQFMEWDGDHDSDDSSSEVSAGEWLDINFYCFKTVRGRLLVELRTSHNGYYSGRLELQDTNDKQMSDKGWKEIL